MDAFATTYRQVETFALIFMRISALFLIARARRATRSDQPDPTLFALGLFTLGLGGNLVIALAPPALRAFQPDKPHGHRDLAEEVVELEPAMLARRQ